MGTWTKESNEINNRPIYKKGSYYLAVKTVTGNIIPSWVAASTPGSSSGFMFGQSRAPKCPHAVSTWTYFSQNTGAIEDDDSLKVTCGAGQYISIIISHEGDIICQNALGPSPPPPRAPP